MIPQTKSLPYTKPETELPGPLPTLEQIKTAPDRLLKDTFGHRVVQINSRYVAKYGLSIKQAEGETLLYLEAVSCPYAPRLYAMYAHEPDHGVCLVMDFIPGETLSDLWPSLEGVEKHLICKTLRTCFEDIRSFLQDGRAFFGSVDHGPLSDSLFYDPSGDAAFVGPFSSERALNDSLVNRFRKIGECNGNSPQYATKAAFYARNLPRVLRDHKIVFTHGDLQRKNVLVRRNTESGGHDFTVALVDWEDAGWYPEYWEYFSAFEALHWDDDWCDMIEEIIDSWPAATGIMHMIYKEIFF
ncbi:MAG: hypothetical protein M1828_004810 [Chrysothrix sp. TS-e1954]|nr:MAG: hypothetical protein M1828_004810 [Chrysothrix sp. TS-e1954]